MLHTHHKSEKNANFYISHFCTAGDFLLLFRREETVIFWFQECHFLSVHCLIWGVLK